MGLSQVNSVRALSADASAVLLTAKIRAREPFYFLRYGDGALECMLGRPGGTCDGERYTAELGLALVRAIRQVIASETLWLGDWMSASFDPSTEATRYRELYEALIVGARNPLLHFEALLLMRESEALVDFYRAIKEDPRRKVFIGPQSCAGAAKMLDADHCIVPITPDLHRYFEQASTMRLWDAVEREEILLYGAGMAAHPQVVECWKRRPDLTYVNLGSAMDPLFRGATRRQQISRDRARALFRELL